jgi:phage-related protein
MPTLAYIRNGRAMLERVPVPVKPVVWVGDSLEVLRTFPGEVQWEMGHAIFQAQKGDKHERAKPLLGFGSGVLEVVTDYRGDTFRAVYTVRLAGRVYVLHVFQKKSKRGIATPRLETESVRRRMRRAEELHVMLGGQP